MHMTFANKKASKTTDIIRHNRNLYLENEENVSSVYPLKKVVHEIVPLWLRNRNQRVHIIYMGGLMRWEGALHEGGGLYQE